LVAGNVIIGRREEKDTGVMGGSVTGGEGEVERGEEGEGLLGEEIGLQEGGEGGFKGRSAGERGRAGNEDDDDILDLGLERVKSEDENR